MLNLYELLGVHMKASEPEILVALARLEYKAEDNSEEIAQAVKRYLLSEEVREVYNQQLLAECPNLMEEKYHPIDVSILFEITDKNGLLTRLQDEYNKLSLTNSTLEAQIQRLRTEEKIYRFPVRNRELLDINDRFFYRSFSSTGAKTVFASLLQILINNKRTTKNVIYTESKGFSYARVYEYIILKYKVKGRKKYILSRFDPHYLREEKGLSLIEPATPADGSIYQTRILIDADNPMYLEDLAIDHVIQEALSVYDYTIECIQTFNEAVLEIKKQRNEDFRDYKQRQRNFMQKLEEQRKQVADDNRAGPLVDNPDAEQLPDDKKDTGGLVLGQDIDGALGEEEAETAESAAPESAFVDEIDGLQMDDRGFVESYKELIGNDLSDRLDHYVDSAPKGQGDGGSSADPAE